MTIWRNDKNDTHARSDYQASDGMTKTICPLNLDF